MAHTARPETNQCAPNRSSPHVPPATAAHPLYVRAASGHFVAVQKTRRPRAPLPGRFPLHQFPIPAQPPCSPESIPPLPCRAPANSSPAQSPAPAQIRPDSVPNSRSPPFHMSARIANRSAPATAVRCSRKQESGCTRTPRSKLTSAAVLESAQRKEFPPAMPKKQPPSAASSTLPLLSQLTLRKVFPSSSASQVSAPNKSS